VIELRMRPGADAAAALTQVKLTATRFPGEHELRIRLVDDAGATLRTLALGPLWLYDAGSPCMAALSEFGEPSILIG
jgi:hypothetical protein